MSVLNFDVFKQFPNLVAAVAKADYGNMSARYGLWHKVRQNRRRFFSDIGVPEEKVVVSSLVHGHKIIEVTDADRGKGIGEPETTLEGDILITDEPDTYLFFVVADCLALFYFEPFKQICALAHAGWRGVDQKVPELTVEYMVRRWGCDRSKIFVAMSPALQCESSRNEDIEQKDKPGWQAYIKTDTKLGRKVYCVDWTRFAYDQIINSGVKPDNIERSMIDTKTSSDYFSHSRAVESGEPEGRFGCLIGRSLTP